MRRGSVTQRFVRCNKPGCPCRDRDDARHGPYHSVSRVVKGRTQSRWLKAEEVEIDVHENDLQIDTYRSSGAGGQSVNTTDSAVRILHRPSGIMVTMQDEKSQHKNKVKAMKVLRARLYEAERERQEAEMAEERRSQVSTGDRSAKIRTYNFPQSRVTDHRIGMTLHGIEQVMGGDLDSMIDALATHFQAEQIASQSE